MKTVTFNGLSTEKPLWRRLDPAVSAMAAILLILVLIDPPQGHASVTFVAQAALNVLPFMLAALLAAAWVEAAAASRLVAAAFAGHPVRMIVLGALAGALSPFCSCGVIPIITALLASGVPLAPVMAFWLSSPLMDPAMFLMTAGTLGFEFAVAKTLAAAGIGLLGGFGTWALVRADLIGPILRGALSRPACSSRGTGAKTAVMWRFWREAERLGAFRRSFVSTGRFLAGWMALAFLLESLMIRYVPADLVAQFAGGPGVLPIVTATLAGIPAYLNGYAALPLVAGLVSQGMSEGAAIGFLLGGGVTSIPAVVAVWAIARARVFVTYIAFALTGAVASGLIFGVWSA